MDTPSPPSSSSRYIDRSRLVACRECRRSKIRCSRTFPCDACTRRGCTDICPDGIKETKRSKSDENLLQENARLVRRIRHLEGMLSSLRHPDGLLPSSACKPNDPGPASPGQESLFSEMSPSSDDSESPTANDPYFEPHRDRDRHEESVQAAVANESGNHGDLHSPRGHPALGHSPLSILETDLAEKRAILAPGCQFTLRALLELCRACGVIDHQGSNGKITDSNYQNTAVSRGLQSLFSSPSPPDASSPTSSSSISDTPLPDSDSDVSAAFSAPLNAEQDIWGLSPDMFPTFPSLSSRDQGHLNTHHASGSTGGSHFRPGKPDFECDEPMSFELCQRLLVDLGIVSGQLEGMETIM